MWANQGVLLAIENGYILINYLMLEFNDLFSRSIESQVQWKCLGETNDTIASQKVKLNHKTIL